MAKLIQAIHVQALRGDGTPANPYRNVDEYWSTDGQLLAIEDVDIPRRLAELSEARDHMGCDPGQTIMCQILEREEHTKDLRERLAKRARTDA